MLNKNFEIKKTKLFSSINIYENKINKVNLNLNNISKLFETVSINQIIGKLINLSKNYFISTSNISNIIIIVIIIIHLFIFIFEYYY